MSRADQTAAKTAANLLIALRSLRSLYDDVIRVESVSELKRRTAASANCKIPLVPAEKRNRNKKQRKALISLDQLKIFILTCRTADDPIRLYGLFHPLASENNKHIYHRLYYNKLQQKLL